LQRSSTLEKSKEGSNELSLATCEEISINTHTKNQRKINKDLKPK